MSSKTWGIAFALLLLASCTRIVGTDDRPGFLHSIDGAAAPWTHAHFDAAPDRFTFAIVSDLQGGEREGVFRTAIAQLSLLRPELILTVGDLIDGNSEDTGNLHGQWDAFDVKTGDAIAPVFYAGGNHDLTNQVMRDVWAGRYGPRYYDFVYSDVLFIVLDTEDTTAERMREVFLSRAAAIEVFEAEGWDAFRETEYFHMPERTVGRIGAEQVAHVEGALRRYADVRWTFVLMHKPAWQRADESGFAAIEALLAERPYTVINGHEHRYAHTERHGRDYLTLGTTGGSQDPASAMSFDHVTLVTMSGAEPSIVNLRLSGILDRTGHVPLGGDDLCFQASRCGNN